MRARLVVSILIVLFLAGCVEDAPADPAVTPAASKGVTIDESRPDTAFKDVVTGPVALPDLNATLAAPPKLIPGEWWRLRFDSPLAGGVIDVVRVVAAVEETGYLIGMPHEGWFKEAIAYHSPAFGDVNFDLSYATHNVNFQPMRFPLVEGDTWETAFAAIPMIAKVVSVEGTKATVTLSAQESDDPADPLYMALGLSSSGEAMRLVYDASLHEVAYFESSIGSYEIVEHGYDFEGWITIPRGEHTAIDYGQFGPATPGEPLLSRTIEVAGGFNRLTLMQVVFPITTGSYSVRAVAPDGTEYRTESTSDQFIINFFEATMPDGTWTSEDIVAGVGATYSMGIAYHQYDIRLPDGARRSDHGHAVIR